ncbi:5'/3'-nucleotidase SurE [Natronobeatus ordinarius]|uniref:5'/3'-nucleotidase SurE n=1 Tax=Natronobeatus ordinarius TaxID=2963433 RepID=UPI0020CD1166|nr:5'/3'-nucleotidase SurE [Natronobeatus ordinarius]
MSERLEIVLTNDDGIDSTGLQAVYDALSEIAHVTVVAPADDQSAVGRSMSHEVTVDEHDLGYAVEGTPADCVVAAMGELGPEPDLVVAGCNRGANLGEYVIGRSGTVSAAIEAAFFDVPAIATSLYVPAGDISYREVEITREQYVEAVRATRYLVDRAPDTGIFDRAAVLNVNAPVPDGDEPAPLELTVPSDRYEMDASVNGDGSIRLADRIWERMDPETLPDPEGTDRRAVVDGRVSITPLSVPQATVRADELEALTESYPDAAVDLDL